MRTRRLVAFALALLATPVLAVAAPVQKLPDAAPASAVLTMLAELNVAKPQPMTGCTRTRFRHWANIGEHCDAREIVLIRGGHDVTADANTEP